MNYLNQVEFKALGNNESGCRFKSYDNYKDELIEKGIIGKEKNTDKILASIEKSKLLQLQREKSTIPQQVSYNFHTMQLKINIL